MDWKSLPIRFDNLIPDTHTARKSYQHMGNILKETIVVAATILMEIIMNKYYFASATFKRKDIFEILS